MRRVRKFLKQTDTLRNQAAELKEKKRHFQGNIEITRNKKSGYLDGFYWQLKCWEFKESQRVILSIIASPNACVKRRQRQNKESKVDVWAGCVCG